MARLSRTSRRSGAEGGRVGGKVVLIDVLRSRLPEADEDIERPRPLFRPSVDSRVEFF